MNFLSNFPYSYLKKKKSRKRLEKVLDLIKYFVLSLIFFKIFLLSSLCIELSKMYLTS